jgi:hypothetical protein
VNPYRNTEPRDTPAPAPFTRCGNALANRWREGRERGDLLLEALIFMAVIALTASAYLGTAMTSQAVVRSSQTTDIVSQQAQETMEALKVVPWASLAFNPNQTSPQDQTTALPYGSKQIVATDAVMPATAIPPVSTITIKGVTMTRRVYIVWRSPLTPNPVPAAGAAGTKDIYIRMTFKRPGDTVSRSTLFTMSRTSTAAEAQPIVLPNSAVAGTPGDPTPGCVDVYRKDPNTLKWNQVYNATSASVTKITNATGVGTTTAMTATATSLARTVDPAYTYRFSWTVSGSATPRISCEDVQ